MNDTDAFIQSLKASLDSLPTDWRNLFDRPREIVVTRAPGRLDLMGGIADYSGSLVLQLPLAVATHVGIQRSEDTRIRIASLSVANASRVFEMEVGEFSSGDAPIDYAEARARFSQAHWAAYVAGAFLVLMRERNVSFKSGARILISSDVPEGKGVSSSAALEVAAMQAIVSAFETEVSPQELALLCQKVENLIAGAPCGVMDQMTAACGEKERLLELLCQPAELKGSIALPEELAVWGIDSGVRHSISGADYGTVRTAAFMGYRIIAELAGLPVHGAGAEGKLIIEDSKWKGYLANVTPEEFEREYAAKVPELLTGADFLDRYDGISDAVTCLNRETEYPVLAATRHPIHEHDRVKAFAAVLKDWQGIEQASKLGRLMFESHESYSACGLGCEATDALVELVRDACDESLYGAKITGGGSGGTVAVLGRRESGDAVTSIAERFSKLTGHRPIIFSGSSAGAAAFGCLRLTS
jgi:galactokinase